MSSLSSLNFILTANIEQFQNQLRKASNELKRTGASFKSAGQGMTMGITAPIVAAGAAIAMITTRSAEFADSIDEMSTRTGVAKSTLQELSFVAGQVGIDFPNMEKSMAKLNKSMGDAAGGSKTQAEAFSQLGIQVTDSEGNLRSMSDVFPEVIGALSKMQNETERNYLTMQLFGKGANQVITPLTELGQQGLQVMIDKAHELGVVMGDEGITSLAEYNDAMAAMKDQAAGVGREMSIGFAKIMKDSILPIIQEKLLPAMKALAGWFNNLSPGVKTAILVFAGLAAAIGPILIIIGTLATTVIPGLVIAFGFLKTAFLSLTTSIASNPIGALVTVLGLAVGALLMFKNRSKEAADAQHQLGTEVDGVSNSLGKQIWDQLAGKTAEKMEDGTLKITDAYEQLGTKITSLTKGELEQLKSYLENQLLVATRDAENETSELLKTMAGEEIDRMKKGLELINVEMGKFTAGEKAAIPVAMTLEERISALEEQLWNEVKANDASASSTARKLAVLKQELQYYKDKQGLLTEISRMESIKPQDVQLSANVMGPPEGDLLFARETLQAREFGEELENLQQVSTDVSSAVQGAVAQMASQFGQTLGKMMAGTATTSDLFDSLLDMIGSFLTTLGEALIASAAAAIAFDELLTNPYVAMAAGIALVALGALVSSILSKGPSGTGGESFNLEGNGSYTGDMPRAASGAVVTRPTVLMAGEGGESEAIIPISTLMSNVYNAIAHSGNISGSSNSMQPIMVTGKIEGKLKSGEIYLSTKIYNEKLRQAK